MPAVSRMPLIDALKAVAALLIMLNHFASYGPLAVQGRQVLPTLFDGLYDYGRMAVQVFLVIAGFLAARTLSPHAAPLLRSPWPLIGKRYRRLMVPYGAALLLATGSAALSRYGSDDPDVPAAPSFEQVLAHLLLLQGILGFESLSAGIWYIAIDFQLFALFALLMALPLPRWVAPGLVLGLAAASLLWLNRNPGLDNWAVYFFGAYGLGIVAWWGTGPAKQRYWFYLVLAVAVAALLLEFRWRLCLALMVAVLLAGACNRGWLWTWPDIATLNWLGQISFALFLVHYPVLLLVNTAYASLGVDSVMLAGFCLAMGVVLSIAAADLFHRTVESRGIDKSG